MIQISGWDWGTGYAESNTFEHEWRKHRARIKLLAFFMPKFELAKTIEAVKLNPRTMRRLSPEKFTIPYGAILDKLERDRDTQKFHYLGEPYECPLSDIESALKPLP